MIYSVKYHLKSKISTRRSKNDQLINRRLNWKLYKAQCSAINHEIQYVDDTPIHYTGRVVRPTVFRCKLSNQLRRFFEKFGKLYYTLFR